MRWDDVSAFYYSCHVTADADVLVTVTKLHVVKVLLCFLFRMWPQSHKERSNEKWIIRMNRKQTVQVTFHAQIKRKIGNYILLKNNEAYFQDHYDFYIVAWQSYPLMTIKHILFILLLSCCFFVVVENFHYTH